MPGPPNVLFQDSSPKQSAYGQCLPTTLDEDDDSDDMMPSTEAMRYLKGVIEQAKALPSLFVTSEPENPWDPTIEESDRSVFKRRRVLKEGDSMVGIEMPDPDDEEAMAKDPPDLLAAAIKQRFIDTRSSFDHDTDAPLDIDTDLHPFEIDPSIFFVHESHNWGNRFIETKPTYAQMWHMDRQTALQLARVMTWALVNKRHLYLGKPKAIDNLGTWCFALLARLGAEVPFAADDASDIREVGKAASEVTEVLLGVRPWGKPQPYKGSWKVAGYSGTTQRKPKPRVTPREAAREEELELLRQRARQLLFSKYSDALEEDEEEVKKDNSEGEVGGGGEGEDKVKKVKELVIVVDEEDADDDDEEEEEASDQNIEAAQLAVLAVMESIIIIVGEMYGQRDLLETRQLLWSQ